MLIVQRGARRAFHIPLLLMTFGALFAAAAIHSLVTKPSIGSALGTALTTAMFVALSLDLRAIVVRGQDLVIRGPRQHHTFKRGRCALSVRANYSQRGATYTVFVSDGTRSADLSDHTSAKSADRALARLEPVLLDAPSAHAAAKLKRSREQWESAEQQARATVDAYYRSPAWRNAKWIVVGLVVTYCLVMIAIMAAHR